MHTMNSTTELAGKVTICVVNNLIPNTSMGWATTTSEI
jgi:hypothetical protein